MLRTLVCVLMLVLSVERSVAADYHGAMLQSHQHANPPSFCRPGYVWVPLYSWVEWRWDDEIGDYPVIRTRWRLVRANICR